MVKEYFTLVSEENDTKQILVSLRAEILGKFFTIYMPIFCSRNVKAFNI